MYIRMYIFHMFENILGENTVSQPKPLFRPLCAEMEVEEWSGYASLKFILDRVILVYL